LCIILIALHFIGCNKLADEPTIDGTVITGCDGITVIKGFQERLSNRVEINIIMRPEMKKTVYVLWYTTDSEHKTRQYRSAINHGAPSATEIAVTPGAFISDIRITGYERIGV